MVLAEHGSAEAIDATFAAVDTCFRLGHRVCLVGVLALRDACDRFASPVRGYFAHWIEALARSGRHTSDVVALAEAIMANIQGAVVLALAFDNPGVLSRAVARLRRQTVHPQACRDVALAMDAPQTNRFAKDERFPNSCLSVLVYLDALPPDPAVMEQAFARQS